MQFVLAGPLPHGGEVGGVVVLFESLANRLRNEADVVIVDTNGRNYRNGAEKVAAFVSACCKAARHGASVGLHGTARDYLYLGPILFAFRRSVGLRYHTRKFAGNFDAVLRDGPAIRRGMALRFLSASTCNFFETHRLVSAFSSLNSRTEWFPNHRPPSSAVSAVECSGRFCYVGQVSPEKGVGRLLAAARCGAFSQPIDLFGPLRGYSYSDLAVPMVRYRGELRPQDVPRTLSKYCGLLVPTQASSEGYPGVILEAFSVGVPVIATRVGGIDELITGENGILLESASADEIGLACRRLEHCYASMREGARRSFPEYEESTVLGRYISQLSSLGGRRSR